MYAGLVRKWLVHLFFPSWVEVLENTLAQVLT